MKNQRFPLQPGRQQAGFTLLEVAVAVAICGLAIVGLFHAGSIGLFAADVAGKTEEAIQRAQSHLANIGRDKAAIAEGESEADDGGGFRWRLRVHPVAAQNIQAAPAAIMTLYDVEVAVLWRAGGRDRSVALHTRRLSVAPPP
jgi:general secretion pathway protein I